MSTKGAPIKAIFSKNSKNMSLSKNIYKAIPKIY